MLNRADRHIVDLPTGRVEVEVAEAAWPLAALCGFAARNNPRRGFLVVSKVLGRHIPAKPSTMRRSVVDLAARVPTDLPGPVAVVGLAETAVCLGQALHEEWRARSGRDDAWFIHSTRQRVDHPLLCRFEEPHSHASAHLIYRPDGLPTPRTLLLVDDEVSTGTTLANLADALVRCWPGVERIAVATLTDWSDGTWLAGLPRPATVASLLSGRLSWTPGGPPAEGASAAFDRASGSLGTMAAHANVGRLGIAAPIDPNRTPPAPARPLRVVGTGEFTYLPFRLAEVLEDRGHDVVVQATSRSPARIGGAIRTAFRFRDNYATGVANFLYNADPADGRETWICHETPAGSIDAALVAALDARLIDWSAP